MKDIPGFEGIYSIMKEGKVWSHKRNKKIGNNAQQPIGGFFKKQYLTSHGYYAVNLTNNYNRKVFYIHRLIAQAYIPNPDNLPCINHKNGIKTDNRIENLEWCTHLHNALHAWEKGLQKPHEGLKGMKGFKAKLTDTQVLEIRRLHKEENKTLHQLGAIYGVAWQTIGSITSGRNWKHI